MWNIWKKKNWNYEADALADPADALADPDAGGLVKINFLIKYFS